MAWDKRRLNMQLVSSLPEDFSHYDALFSFNSLIVLLTIMHMGL